MNPKNHHDNRLGGVRSSVPGFSDNRPTLCRRLLFCFPFLVIFFLPWITYGGIAASWMINVDVDKGAWVIERWM
jgi:hypothetical protein